MNNVLSKFTRKKKSTFFSSIFIASEKSVNYMGCFCNVTHNEKLKALHLHCLHIHRKIKGPYFHIQYFLFLNKTSMGHVTTLVEKSFDSLFYYYEQVQGALS